jgi:anthranilate synthase component 1
MQQLAATHPADTQTPIGMYMRFVGDDPGLLLQSAEVDGRLGRYSLIAWDFCLSARCSGGKLAVSVRDPEMSALYKLTGMDFIPGLRQLMDSLDLVPPETHPGLPALSRSLLGYFGYELAGLLEPGLVGTLDPEDAECALVLPGRQILFDHLHQRCVLLGLERDPEPEPQSRSRERIGETRAGPAEPAISGETFRSGVERVREEIRAGEAIQAVLSCRYRAEFEGDPFLVYRRLRQNNPSPYMFYVNLPELTLIGSSPEVLVRCTDGVLEGRPIAGTRPRGTDAGEDEALARELCEDPKERAEHVMLVDLGRNDLGRIAEPGSVSLERFMQVERFSHVMHLTSYLQARASPDLDALDVLRATFPAGTVSGAPKIRAMEMIRDIEPLPRGPYSGAVGWLGLDRDRLNLDTGIAIRTMWLRDGTMTWQAGAGVVSDSDPESEWLECWNKAKVLLRSLNQNGGGDVFAHR